MKQMAFLQALFNTKIIIIFDHCPGAAARVVHCIQRHKIKN